MMIIIDSCSHRFVFGILISNLNVCRTEMKAHLKRLTDKMNFVSFLSPASLRPQTVYLNTSKL